MTESRHTLVTGPSGGGKSTRCRQMHAEFDGVSVYLTTKSRSREGSIDGRSVSGPEGLVQATKSASSWSDVRAVWYSADYPEATRTVRSWAQHLVEQAGVPVQVIVDECQDTPLPDGEGALKRGLHEDRDVPIKWVLATQHPQSLKEQKGYPAVSQCRYIVWCGQARSFQDGFINYYHLDAIDGGLPTEDYEVAVIEPTRPPTLLHRTETDPSY